MGGLELTSVLILTVYMSVQTENFNIRLIATCSGRIVILFPIGQVGGCFENIIYQTL